MFVIVPGIVSGISSLKDGSVKTTVHLQEVSPETVGNLYSLNNQHVKIYMTTENITQEAKQAVDEVEIEHESKSPSKRMRDVLFRLWEQDKQGYEDFELWYRWKMNQMVEHLKAKLV